MILSVRASMAQSTSLLMGARATGLGYAASCLADEWSLLNNPGGLSGIKRLTIAFSENYHPRFAPFNRSAGVIAFPIASGSAGLSVFRFGDDLYNEQLISAAFSNRLGIASLGLKINYVQYRAEGFGRHGVFTISFGGIAYITKSLMIGAHITNLNQPVILPGDDPERVPTRVAAGMALQPSERFFITMEAEKDLDRQTALKMGVEYGYHQKFFFRTGFNLQPEAAFFGLGFKPRRVSFDYGVHYDFNIGLNHQVTTGYKFLKK